ncbi:hypothetical protein BX661DRAFT_171001 [Kickxella alabastrina]|uniref:uncharacterized protein n=1 Tax=Kickxella alabastrina TaxID=61397 RepID=UPI002220CE17|nr:uncharacterized protein BX661DRAFT_171001 [Kickxella alabastrina]KAI7827770.1 hypothetical protein BX661DRAFT_171001 [Kickxella alabastrina]
MRNQVRHNGPQAAGWRPQHADAPDGCLTHSLVRVKLRPDAPLNGQNQVANQLGARRSADLVYVQHAPRALDGRQHYGPQHRRVGDIAQQALEQRHSWLTGLWLGELAREPGNRATKLVINSGHQCHRLLGIELYALESVHNRRKPHVKLHH